MDARVQLVFLGEVLAGHRLEDVKHELGRMLKLDDDRLAKLFSGARAVLKRSITEKEAMHYVAHFSRLGARLHIEAMPLEAATHGTAPHGASSEAPRREGSAHAASTTSTSWPVITGVPEAHTAERVPAREPQQAPAPRAAASAPPIPTAAPAPFTPAPVAAASPASSPAPLALLPTAEEEIVCPNCGERQSKRVFCRSCSTNMPMGIAAKQEEEDAQRQERLLAFRERHGIKAAKETPSYDERSPSLWGLSFEGRIARLPYATANTMLLASLVLLTMFFVQKPGIGRFLLAGLGVLMVLYQSMRLAVLRCHDCDRHGWWSLFTLVPYVGTVASLLLSFLPGNPGDNDYGEPPRPGRWFTLLLAVLGLVIAVTLLFRAAFAAYDKYRHLGQTTEEGFQRDELAEALHSTEAASAFRNEYLLAPNHKAFAASQSGAWGWRSGAASLEDAVRGALEECEARRKAYSPRCVPIDADGAAGAIR